MNHANFKDILASMLRREKFTDKFSFYGSCNYSRSNDSKTSTRGNVFYVNEYNDKSIGEKPSRLLPFHHDGIKINTGNYWLGRQSVVDAILAIARGEIFVVYDVDRENEGDFIMAADAAKPERLAIIVRYSNGIVSVGMEGIRMENVVIV